MANGIIALTRFGNAANATLHGRLVWSSVSNGTVENTSAVSVSVQLKRPANSWTQGTWKGTIHIGSTVSDFSEYLKVESEWITVASTTATIGHNADGTCACYLYCKINGPAGTSMEGSYLTGSATVTLDRIPRYAVVASVSDFTDEGNPVVTYSNPAGTAVSSLQACISLTGSKDDVPYRDIPKTGTKYTFSLTESERNTLRAATPDSNLLTVYVYIRSVIGGVAQTNGAACRMTIVNADPVISPTVVDTNSVTSALTGNPSILVALHSTAKVTINAAAKKYATIKSKRVEHGSAVLTGDGTLNVTNNPVKITVTDSRGNAVTQNAGNTIVPYIDPTCLIGNNLPEADGSFSLTVQGIYYNGSIGKTANTLEVQYRYKAAGGSYGSWTAFRTITKNGNGYTATENLTGLDYQTIYTFQARVIDAIHDAVNVSSVYSAEKAVISQPVFDWGQYNFQFNVPVDLKAGCEIRKNGVTAYAPNGYGLGNTAYNLKEVTNANDAYLSGWYLLAKEAANGVGYKGVMRVDAYSSTELMQTVYHTNYSTTHPVLMQRMCIRGNWGVWEWVNPPMSLGVEYRTTERWNGKAVYTMLANLGATAATATVTIPVTSITNLIRYTPNLNNQVSDEWDVYGAKSAGGSPNVNNAFYFLAQKNSASQIYVYVVCGSLRTNKTLYAQFWYTID